MGIVFSYIDISDIMLDKYVHCRRLRCPTRSVVLVKQVPDTKNITGEAMTPEGTINRAALPTVFNPEDLNALEMALQVRDREGGEVTVITMGPPSAADILRDSLFRGADRVILLSDRRFAGADTLATSYALACAIRKLGDVDLVFAGRQAIDGDTAQVGTPDGREARHTPDHLRRVHRQARGRDHRRQRALDQGTEMVKCTLPCLLTVVSSANEPQARLGTAADRVQARGDEARVQGPPRQVAFLRDRGGARSAYFARGSFLLSRRFKFGLTELSNSVADMSLVVNRQFTVALGINISKLGTLQSITFLSFHFGNFIHQVIELLCLFLIKNLAGQQFQRIKRSANVSQVFVGI